MYMYTYIHMYPKLKIEVRRRHNSRERVGLREGDTAAAILQQANGRAPHKGLLAWMRRAELAACKTLGMRGQAAAAVYRPYTCPGLQRCVEETRFLHRLRTIALL